VFLDDMEIYEMIIQCSGDIELKFQLFVLTNLNAQSAVHPHWPTFSYVRTRHTVTYTEKMQNLNINNTLLSSTVIADVEQSAYRTYKHVLSRFVNHTAEYGF
jgi:hypothetical protein